MLYSEFIDGTGCRDTEHNRKIYRDLEVMYMNSDLTKEDIYSYGIKLVDNSLTPEEMLHNERIQAEIDGYQEEINGIKAEIEHGNSEIEWRLPNWEPEWIAYYKTRNKELKKDIRRLREKIKWAKACIITA